MRLEGFSYITNFFSSLLDSINTLKIKVHGLAKNIFNHFYTKPAFDEKCPYRAEELAKRKGKEKLQHLGEGKEKLQHLGCVEVLRPQRPQINAVKMPQMPNYGSAIPQQRYDYSSETEL